jgi:tight adherence protein B
LNPLIAALLVMAGGFAAVWWLLRRAYIDRMVSERLADADRDDDRKIDEPHEAPRRPFRHPLQRYYWAAPLSGVLCSLLLALTASVPWVLSFALGTLSGMLAWQLESVLAARRVRLLEQQLADALDMMIAAVKSGASLLSAIGSAQQQASQPLRAEFDFLAGRVRLGDEPSAALSDLAERVPLESFELFTQALAVNWTVGGQLSATLASIARTVRDRIELTRRMHSMTMQSRLSVISVMAVTYFLGALMWRNDPERMGGFLSSLIGQWAVAVAVVLQGVGVLWISLLSRPRF